MISLTFCETEHRLIYRLVDKFGKIRRVFVSRELLNQYQSEMSNWPKDRNKEFNPTEQFEQLIIRLANNKQHLVGDWDVKPLKHEGQRILFYLRTEDVRIFGLIKAKGEILLTHVFYNKKLKEEKINYLNIRDKILIFAYNNKIPSYRPNFDYVEAINAKR